jgi:4'-phosphopantetheinyl transferase
VELRAPCLVTLPPLGSVDIWHFQCESASPATTATLAQTLSEHERVTAARFRDDAQRSRYIANHATARAILGSYAPELMLGTTPQGKPYVAAPEAAKHLRFNMAHSGALCVVAVAAQEVGVDIERVRGDIAMDEIAQMYFTPRELAALRRVPEENRAEAFFACWTRKEALLKAQGSGFLRPPPSIDVGSDFLCDGWAVTRLDVSPGYAGAVAVKGSHIRLRSVCEWAG